MKKYLIVVIASFLTACGSLPTGLLDNRALCTVSGDKGYVASLYGPIGITSSLNKDDAAVLCSAAKGVAK